MLLVVRASDAKYIRMIVTLLLTLTANSPMLPKPLTQAQSNDIGCVAALAVLAGKQSQNLLDAKKFADVRSDGRKWAGLVGDRITFESGQPKEVIGFAIRQTAKTDPQTKLPRAAYLKQTTSCINQMKLELANDLIKDTRPK